ncbi:hypothetical protein SALBM311S_03081 [Streptomyces alboniger]
MVDLTPDEIPMPQARLDLLRGRSGKAYGDWLQAHGDEFDDGIEGWPWTRSTAGRTPSASGAA